VIVMGRIKKKWLAALAAVMMAATGLVFANPAADAAEPMLRDDVLTWGNSAGSATPIEVGLPPGVTATEVAAGNAFKLALGSDGSVYAWGNNVSGQLGNGTTVTSATPIKVKLPAGVTATAIAAGDSHSLAVGSDGLLYAWGANGSEQLGDVALSLTNRSTPVRVFLPAGVTATAIAAGMSHSLAIGSDGVLYAWGAHNYGGITPGGQIVTGPQKVSMPTGVTKVEAVAAGSGYSLVVADGSVYGWGVNDQGQLGNDKTNHLIPVKVAGLAGVTVDAVAAGYAHSLALASDGSVYAWGADSAGQLGDGTTTQQLTPVKVALPAGVKATAVAAGSNYSLALASDGSVYAWGYNGQGQLGDGTTTSHGTPVKAAPPANVITVDAVAAGYMDSMAAASMGSGPIISGGATVENTLTAAPGGWTAGADLTYQWTRDGAPIPGATGANYTLVGADADTQIAVKVTGSKPGYTTVTSGSASVTVTKGTLTVGPPTITGSANVGSTLTAAPGTGTAGADLAYQWTRNGAPIAGATGPAYTPVAADLGTQIAVTLTVSRLGYTTVNAASAAVTVATGTLTVGPPTITGGAKVGSTLTAKPGTGTAGADLAYQWTRNGAPINGATGQSYTLVTADAGKQVAVSLTITKPGYSTVSNTSAAVTIEGMLTVGTPTITGTWKVGGKLTVKAGNWADATLGYQWTRNGAPIKGATGASYTLVAADAGKTVTVTVTGSKPGYTTVTKPAPGKVVGKGTLTAPVPRIAGTAKVGKTLTAKAGAWTKDTKLGYQWLANGKVVKKGPKATTVKLTKAMQGKKITVKVTGSKAGYITVTKISTASKPVAK
jgi:alpha-tubulin suppressor-like RCC1 family protein